MVTNPPKGDNHRNIPEESVKEWDVCCLHHNWTNYQSISLLGG